MASLDELLKAKEPAGGEDDTKRQAKMEVLQQLRKMAMDLMSEDMEGAMQNGQSVTVAADDEEGLKQGLEMAEDVVEEGPEAMVGDVMAEAEDEMDYDDEEADVSGELEMEDPSDIERQIAELEEKKRQLMMKS